MRKKKRDMLLTQHEQLTFTDEKLFKKSDKCWSCCSSVGYQLIKGDKIPENYFSGISDEMQDALLTLMARIMETAYRRGCQQTYEFLKRGIITKVDYDYRYHHDFDFSPSLENPDKYGGMSRSRLSGEYWQALHTLGFRHI